MRSGALIVLGLLLGGLPSAGRTEAGERPAHLALAPQSTARFQCGPTTLAAVLAFHGTVVPEKTIADAIYSPTAKGALLTDLAWYARSKGFQTEVRTGTPEDLQRMLAAGDPPIVLLDLGLASIRVPHFTALLGWNGDEVRYQGRRRAGTVVTANKFIRQWQRAGNQYLVITPAS